MSKPVKPRWADGDPSYTDEPAESKKDTGWGFQEQPPFEWQNWLHLQTKKWIDYFETWTETYQPQTIRSSSPVHWSGSDLTFEDNIEIVLRNGASTVTNYITAGTLTLSANQVLVVFPAKTSSVNLAQVSYASLAEGTFAIVSDSSLTEDQIENEFILFRKREYTPANHYGVPLRPLEIPFLGQSIPAFTRFYLGSLENLDRPKGSIFDQAIINGNMQVSQRGNFTTAISSSAGLADGRYYLDRWRTEFAGSFGSNATLQRTDGVVSEAPGLTKFLKIVGNTSGSAITGRGLIATKIDAEPFDGKHMTLSFWLGSNEPDNISVEISSSAGNSFYTIDTGSGDGVFRHYTITHQFSTGLTGNITLGVGFADSSGAQVSIDPGKYFEFSGLRFYLGTDILGPLVRTYQDELELCRQYCYGALDGEETFINGYSIYRMNGTARATWLNDADFWLHQAAITENNGTGETFVELPTPLRQDNTISVYLFDNASGTTNGGTGGGNEKVSVTNGTTAVSTDNVSAADSFRCGTRLKISQNTVSVVGILEVYPVVEAEL